MKRIQSKQANTPSIVPQIPVLPSEGYVDIRQLCTNRPKGWIGILPVSEATFRRGMAAGTYPKPKRIGSRTVWAVSDIRELIARIERGEV